MKKIKVSFITIAIVPIVLMSCVDCRDYKVRTRIINPDADDCTVTLTIRNLDKAFHVGDTLKQTEDTSEVIVALADRARQW